jgi:hypothetical protein
MRKIFYPGERGKAPCETCGRLVPATYGYGVVPLEDGTPVEEVMRATCDICGAVVATTPQSAPQFRAALEARDKKRAQQTNVRIQRVLADISRLELTDNQTDPDRFDLLVKAFAMSVYGAPERRWREAVAKLREAMDPAFDYKAEVQVPLYLNAALRAVLEKLQRDAGLSSLSELIRRVLVVMRTDKRAEVELQKLRLVG